MAEGHATYSRRYNVGRDTFLAAAALYEEKYGMDDGSVPVTFQIIYDWMETTCLAAEGNAQRQWHPQAW